MGERTHNWLSLLPSFVLRLNMKKGQKIKVRIREANDYKYNEIKYFKSYQEMIEYMKEEFDSWAVYFKKNKDIDCELWIYDSYIE